MPDISKQQMIDIMIRHPVIAAVRDDKQLHQAMLSSARIIFLLAGSINNLAERCRLLKAANRLCFLHLDLVAGLKPDQEGVLFIARQIRPHGIITTRPASIKWARAAGLLTVQRIFLLDSSALQDGSRHIKASDPDLVEVLPGVADKAISMAVSLFDRPLIAGGLISERSEILKALGAGALAVSTGEPELWNLADFEQESSLV